MSDEQSDKDISSPHKSSYYQQNRSNPSYRGRGRGNASISKALHLFGVRDLREILDRKHQDEEAENGPPPDPSYNYLKDPSRENYNKQQANQSHKYSERASSSSHMGHNFRGSRGRGRGNWAHKENQNSVSDNTTFIKNPVNIKVEVLASSGTRSCTIDEQNKLPDIKHVPNYHLKNFRSRNEVSEGTDFTHKNINRTYTECKGKDFSTKQESDRGRGSGQRGRGRGMRRGGRSERRGRGTRRYPSSSNNENKSSNEMPPPEVPSEENWDPDCVTSTTQDIENEGEHISEENHVEDREHSEDDFQEYYDEGVENNSKTSNELGHKSNESADIGNILEENVIITSPPENTEKLKRTVKFKIEKTKDDQLENLDEGKCEEKLPPKEGKDKTPPAETTK